MDSLPKHEANYVPLTPITFLKRAAMSYADRTSVIYEEIHFTWNQTYQRCCRLASSLISLQITKNDVVSVIAPNVPALYEMHFAVPMAGAVLNAINTSFDAQTVAAILRTSEAKMFFVDYQFIPIAREVIRILKTEDLRIPMVVVIDDLNSPTGLRLGDLEYEQLINQGSPEFLPIEIKDEWDPISLNYTSGTTSEQPKGVVYSHRGAYLGTLNLILIWEMGTEPVYLWSVPMFHCNGWTFAWGVAARGGTNICIRTITAYDMYRNMSLHKVTHMCCAPIMFNILIDAKTNERRDIVTPVQILTGGAPPPSSLVKKIEQLGFRVTHAYGSTEAIGPALVCEWQMKWNGLSTDEKANLKSRQGISVLTLSDVDIKNPKTMVSVPRDGKTIGEVVLRGNSLLKGYFKDEEATSKAFKNGWFFMGDVGVIHGDGYLEMKDRSNDVIISGGEYISSVELENVIYKHPRVLEAAVVAMPHPLFGEIPCAFIAVKKNLISGKTHDVSEMEIIAFCGENLQSFMVPKKVEFMDELPKTSTGKIQKFQLRDLAKTYYVVVSDD